ncbi:hypothetical protein GTQ99_20100 [Kineococcus sp. T13]|uniref:hypothetical protein n=1 Tax=Kineococcus vitellinus TaxID=2696565 RepID=UPI001413730E|nr:hypothetical protein [Kineococcus vitellinus]NAZ77696.1 hypothetical protein [Kineococcus vitellinus]
MTVEQERAARHRRVLEVRRERGEGSPPVAAGLSVLWPGLGHAYLGRHVPAAGLGAVQVALVVLSVLPGAWRVTGPLWLLLVALAVTTSVLAARRVPGGPSVR